MRKLTEYMRTPRSLESSDINMMKTTMTMIINHIIIISTVIKLMQSIMIIQQNIKVLPLKNKAVPVNIITKMTPAVSHAIRTHIIRAIILIQQRKLIILPMSLRMIRIVMTVMKAIEDILLIIEKQDGSTMRT